MTRIPLIDLGWSQHFSTQLALDGTDAGLAARVSDVHRARVGALTETGEVTLELPPDLRAGELAVGDWILMDPERDRVQSLLERRSELRRGSAGLANRPQLIAANVDTLFIVTSCNDDFNPARLERYLALAATGGVVPVILLTKADMVGDAASFLRQASSLSPGLSALTLNAKDSEALASLSKWLQPGSTAALVGSSGVGKSTILNGLSGLETATSDIREDDAKGRHTTTSRSLRRTRTGGWLIDTPGMRSLSMSDSTEGIEKVFSDLTELASGCKFSDCSHETEPGCAILDAVETGVQDAGRVVRWKKLLKEDQVNSQTGYEARKRQKALSRSIKATIKKKRR